MYYRSTPEKYEQLWTSDDNTQLYGNVTIQDNKSTCGFGFVISLDLNIGDYFTLTYIWDESSKLCTIVLSRTKYKHFWTSDDHKIIFGHVTR